MKKIKCAVRCQYWNRPEEFEIQAPENATELEIENAMLEAALEAASLDFWRTD